MTHRSKGQSLVEFALVIPIFLLVLFFAIEASLLLREMQSVLLLTGEIAREVFIGKSDSVINANTSTMATGVGLNVLSLNITINPASATRKSGDLTTVTLTYPHPFLFDFVGFTNLVHQNPYMINVSTKTIVQ